MTKHVMNESDELTDRLRELLQYFHPAAAAEFSSDELRAVVEELLSGAATQKWVADQMAETKIRTADFRKGVAMELEPARDMAAALVAAARTLLMGGENYCESVYTKPEDADRASYSMDVSIPELPERYTLTVQVVAPGKLTPHEARMRAEKVIGKTWQWIADVNDGAGYDTGDLGYMLEQNGFPPPPDDEGKGAE
jgi:hypothetical protein